MAFNDDFKEEVAAYATVHGNKAAARHFGVSYTSVRTWRRAIEGKDTSIARDDGGRFLPGVSGNPGGFSKHQAAIRQRFADVAARALEGLAQILDHQLSLPVDERDAELFRRISETVFERGVPKLKAIEVNHTGGGVSLSADDLIRILREGAQRVREDDP